MADPQYVIEGEPEPFGPPAEVGRQTAEYMQDILGQFESLARRSGFDLLTYLLSMARVEAETLSRTCGPDRPT